MQKNLIHALEQDSETEEKKSSSLFASFAEFLAFTSAA